MLNATVGASHWSHIQEEFNSCHKIDSNVFIHLVTTPMGLLGMLSLLSRLLKTTTPLVFASGVYLLSLVPELSNGIMLGSTFTLLSLLYLSARLRLSYLSSLALLVAGYVLQDLSHSAFGEATMQASYSNGGHIQLSNQWLSKFLEHCYYQVPLLIQSAAPRLSLSEEQRRWFDSKVPDEADRLHSCRWLVASFAIFVIGHYSIDSKNLFCFCPGVPFFDRMINVNIVYDKDGKEYENGESRKADLKIVRDFAMSTNPPETCSTHFWYHELPEKVKEAFYRCSKSKILYDAYHEVFNESQFVVDNIDGMDEIYITGPARLEEEANSDQVFYSRHVDGPWGWIPFVSVYRCIVGMDRNMVVTTHFPLAYRANNACEGDVLGFDFNREVHYITRDDTKSDISDKFRVTLKLHYVMYPRILAPLGWIMKITNEKYNQTFRALFLKTINPQTAYERFLAWQVNFQTWLFDRIETLIGQKNIFFLTFLVTVAFITKSYNFFLFSTSFLHYFRYITTYYVREGVDFGCFKRDVLLFKTISLLQLFFFYAIRPIMQGTFYLDFLSLALIVAGYATSMKATQALGLDRTYFGAELGYVEKKWVDEFPYGYIPHPMIVSQMLALVGIHIFKPFRDQYPQLIPIHLTLYFIHMVQEHLDIHRGQALFARAGASPREVDTAKKTN